MPPAATHSNAAPERGGVVALVENGKLPPVAGISWQRFVLIYLLFLVIALGLGYPTLNRYDPRQVGGLADVKSYAEMVTGNPALRLEHMRYRVLVPWVARPFYRLALRHSGSWDPVLFGLLASNSLFVAGTALLIVTIGTRLAGYPAALVGSLLYLLNFAVPNLRLAGLVDAGEAFFLLALYWALLEGHFWLLPAIAALGATAKESFIPFLVVFTAAWWMVSRKRLPFPRRTMLWSAASWIAGVAALLVIHLVVAGGLGSPLAFVEEMRGNNHYLHQLVSTLEDRNFWYVFAWLLPLGFLRLKRFPRSWLIPTACTAAMAFLLDAYYTGAYGTTARALFSVAGPLLALSTACLLSESPVSDG